MLRGFTWRGTCYPVVEILSNWYLAARWWDPDKHSDRLYHRVETPVHMIFELYYDRVSGAWILDVVQD